MRKDYKHLLVDAGRKKHDVTERVHDNDMDAQYVPIRNHSSYWSPRDYTSPLHRCLRQQVGRPWDKVFSELCQNASIRSLLGQHLRQHIWDIVIPNHNVIKTESGYRMRSRWGGREEHTTFLSGYLFIDDQGILRTPRRKEMRNRDSAYPDYVRYFKKISATSAHIYFSGGWWYVEWQNYNAIYKNDDPRNMPWTRVKKYLAYDHRTGMYELTTGDDRRPRDMKYIYRHDCWRDRHSLIFPTLKRQLSKNEMKNAGLAAFKDR